MSSMRRKVLAKLSPRWKERVIPCSLKVTAFIWGFYSVLGSWLKNTKHSYYPLGWHESDTVPIRNITLKILHLSTVCIKSKIHSCAEGNTKLMNLFIPQKWLKWCIVLVWCREVDFTLGGPQWAGAGAVRRSCQPGNGLVWHFYPSEQGSCSSSWAGVWVRPCSALPWLHLLPMTTLSSWGGHCFLETGGSAGLHSWQKHQQD